MAASARQQALWQHGENQMAISRGVMVMPNNENQWRRGWLKMKPVICNENINRN
jgi:hypothetical protein